MTLRKALWLSGCVSVVLTAVYGAATSSNPQPFRTYRSLEPFDDVNMPPDYQEKTEWVQARLMYPPHPYGRFSRPLNFGGWRDWREGGTSWSQDYPRADRLFAAALRRLTRVQGRSVEQPVNPDDGDDIYNWPWLVAGEMGDWKLTDDQALKIREYLLRGGFLMLDDFWGTREWNRFMESMQMIFPDRQIVDVEDADPIFHIVYDVGEKYQIPGQWALRQGTMYREDGSVPKWRGIYDDKGRLMVAISFNSDIGDSWEWADDARYPEKYSALGIRIGVNDVGEKYQIPGQWALRQGTMYREDGSVPKWRGIYDDKGRLMVAISFNSDIGDSWEWADDARYPEKYSALGIRIGVNDVVYAMSH